MRHEDERLSRCPDCGCEIRSVDVIIAYERSDSTRGVFAECPDCEEVVGPE